MRLRSLFVFVFIFCTAEFCSAQAAQPAPVKITNVYHYYLDITGADTKQKCLELIELIRQQKNILFFDTQDFPSKYFVLRTSAPVSKTDIEASLKNTSFTLTALAKNKKELKLLLLSKDKNSREIHP